MSVPISNVTRRVVFAASGTGPYSFTFEILAATDIAVYKDDALLTLTTDYTVTINANGTGYVTLVASPTGATQIAIVGNRTIQRTTDFVTGGDFFANTVNDEMDQQTIFAQQNAEGLSRSLQAPQTDPTSINMTLPRASVRANKTLAFDTDGNPTTGEQVGDYRGDWATSTYYYKRDLVKDTSNNNVYICTTAHTSSGSQPISTNTDAGKWDLIVDAVSAADAQTAAEAAQAAAEDAQTAAETAETNAASSASSASTSASSASTSATNAASSASSASTSASTASTAATNAGTSATAAATSATAAASSATSAGSSATSASGSATSASSSASAAATSATNAANSASSASTSATNAATSATSAATAKTGAETAQAAAEAALASFNATYLGAKSSDPSLDNEGDPVTAGDWYFNTSSNTSRIYDGSAWSDVALDENAYVAKTSSTGSAVLPAGTTAERDGSPSAGYLRWNSDDTSAEVYDGSAWTAVGGAPTASNMAGKNRIINGAMMIDQRNAGASVTPANGQYLVDRFYAGLTQASKFSAQQNAGAVTPPAGFTNYLGVTSLSAFSVGSGDTFFLQQAIEGFNVTDLGWGAAGAQAITISFWVRSSLTGTFGGSVMNSAVNRAYPFTFAISAANTWEQKSITIAGDTSGTWVVNNGVGLRLSFSLGTGSTLASTAGAWAAGNFLSATGATSVVGTNGATFYITGVQLEKGSVATPFEHRLYGTELALCQRYLPAIIAESTLDSLNNAVITSTTTAYVTLKHPVTARTRPTGVTASATNIITVSGASVTSVIAFNNAGTEYTTLVLTSSGLTTGVAAATFLNTAGAKLLLTGCEL